jgi:AAA family ATP:ADP antiporter
MKRLLAKVVDVKPEEIRALWLSFVFFFVVLGGYYVIRPIRDNIGASSFENLWWMFTVVLLAMVVANALFSTIVARMSRRRFIPIAYRFFIVNLVIFFVLMRWMPPGKQPWIDGCFFVWVSVFNLFATAVFWSFMTDLFTTEQGKRLFGFIAVGGSLGGILGPIITASLVHRVSTGTRPIAAKPKRLSTGMNRSVTVTPRNFINRPVRKIWSKRVSVLTERSSLAKNAVRAARSAKPCLVRSAC